MNEIVMCLNTFLVAVSNRAVGRAQALRQGVSLGRNASAAIAFALLFWTNTALAQSSLDDAPRPIVAPTQAPEGSRASSPPAVKRKSLTLNSDKAQKGMAAISGMRWPTRPLATI